MATLDPRLCRAVGGRWCRRSTPFYRAPSSGRRRKLNLGPAFLVAIATSMTLQMEHPILHDDFSKDLPAWQDNGLADIRIVEFHSVTGACGGGWRCHGDVAETGPVQTRGHVGICSIH